MSNRLDQEYFRSKDALFIAKDLLRKVLVRNFENGQILRSRIVETEAYLGSNDLASHASKGRTQRTEVMFAEGGLVYVYLIYEIHWLLNLVTGPKDHPEAVLIRGVENCIGPGRVGKLVKLDRSFYGENLELSDRIWIEDQTTKGRIITSSRIGVDYAGDIWENKPWRLELMNDELHP